jgi:hypothetical protein
MDSLVDVASAVMMDCLFRQWAVGRMLNCPLLQVLERI